MQPWHCVSRLAVVKSMRILLRSTSSELPTEQPQQIHPNQRPPGGICFGKRKAPLHPLIVDDPSMAKIVKFQPLTLDSWIAGSYAMSFFSSLSLPIEKS